MESNARDIEIKELRNQIKELEQARDTELKARDTELKARDTELQESMKQNDAFKTNELYLHKEIENNKLYIEELRHEHLVEMKQRMQQLSILEERNKDIQREFESERKQHFELQRKSEKLERHIEDIQNEKEKIEHKCSELERKYEELECKKEQDLERKISEYERKISDYERKNAELERRNAHLDRREEHLRNRESKIKNASSNNKNDLLEQEIEKYKLNEVYLNKEINNNQQEIRLLNGIIKYIRASINSHFNES